MISETCENPGGQRHFCLESTVLIQGPWDSPHDLAQSRTEHSLTNDSRSPHKLRASS